VFGDEILDRPPMLVPAETADVVKQLATMFPDAFDGEGLKAWSDDARLAVVDLGAVE
jgi:hypothetical protein